MRDFYVGDGALDAPPAPLPKGGCRLRRLGDIAAFGGMSPKGDKIPPALRATSL